MYSRVRALSGSSIPRRPLEVARGPYWRATARRPRVTHGAVQLRVCRLGRPVLPVLAWLGEGEGED